MNLGYLKFYRKEGCLILIGDHLEWQMVNIAIPSKLTKEQRELFEKLAESLGTAVKPQEKGFLDWLNDAFGG